MSPKYQNEIALLRLWFTQRIIGFPLLSLTAGQYQTGIDSLPTIYSDLCKEAFNEWLQKRSYELSYNQMCIAFFDAVKNIGLLKVA